MSAVVDEHKQAYMQQLPAQQATFFEPYSSPQPYSVIYGLEPDPEGVIEAYAAAAHLDNQRPEVPCSTQELHAHICSQGLLH
jgi:hypothetical protein